MVRWKDKFDMVISMCFTGNRDRVPALDRELDRVGLKPDLRLWNIPNIAEAQAIKAMSPVRSMVENTGFRHSGFGHYRALRTAYELGANRVLIIEDDIRFLKDLDMLGRIVDSVPDFSHIVLFDLLKSGKDDALEVKRQLDRHMVNECWTIPQPRPCSMACYGCDRMGMHHLCRLFSLAFLGAIRLHIADHYLWDRWDPQNLMAIRAAWPLACVQVPIGAVCNSAVRFGGGDPLHHVHWYEAVGIRMEDYMPA